MNPSPATYPDAVRVLRELNLPGSWAEAEVVQEFNHLSQRICGLIDARAGAVSFTGRQEPEPAFFYYAYVLSRRPALVVETGVANGYSSAVILAALAKNGFGHLVSIDYPSYRETTRQIRFDLRHFAWGWNGRSFRRVGSYLLGRRHYLPRGQDPGWAVPPELRRHWSLRQGQSMRILEREGSLRPDVFLHDSDHSYANMSAEFEWAWPRLKPGGLLLSDNVDWNPAWSDFTARHRPARSLVLGQRLGIAVK
jgi:predicted O-methyltransferase YrrM